VSEKRRHVLIPWLLILPLSCGAQEQCLTLGYPVERPNFSSRVRLAEAIFRQAGLCALVRILPAKRITEMIKHGELDGEVIRIESYLKDVPELIAIPTPLSLFQGNLYWLQGRPQPTGQGQSIGVPHDWSWPAEVGRSLNVRLVEVNHSEQLFPMALAGRIDGFILSEADFKGFAVHGVDLRPFTSVTVWREPTHLAVTRAHADLVPRLDAAVRHMAADGELTGLLDALKAGGPRE
jgi:hypothetical protein